MLAACCAFIIYMGQFPEIALDPASYLSTILDDVNIQNVSVNVYLWCLFGSHKLVLYQQQLEKNTNNLYSNRLDRVQQVAVDQANEPSRFKSWVVNVGRGVVLSDSEFPFFGWSKTQGMKENKSIEKRGEIQKVAQSKLQHFAEISRNSMKFLAVPSKQLSVTYSLTRCEAVAVSRSHANARGSSIMGNADP